jgi:cellulose synthase/poly-beta-1,6-N-acetylglucosamine synthase-like glycosyltransferase
MVPEIHDAKHPPATMTPDALSAAFSVTSPRVTGSRTPWQSALVHGLVLSLWVTLVAVALWAHGPAMWLVGLVYLAYDTFLQALTFMGTRELVWPPAHTTSPTTNQVASVVPSLGVIVAAHNEAAVLPEAIAGLMVQSHAPDQIVIADDGSCDGTAQLLQNRFGLVMPPLGQLSAASTVLPALHWLRLPHGGKARALNAAAVQMNTDVIVTVDADTWLNDSALAAMGQAYAQDPHLVAATGVLSPQCDATTIGRLLQWFQTHEYIRNFLARHTWMRLNGLLLISGAFGAYRRQSLLAVGGFDPESMVEDYELVHRLRRHSARQGLHWTTQVVGQARAITEAPSTLSAFLRQRRRWFGGFLHTHYWYRDMVGQRIHGAVGRRMLPVKAMDTLQPLVGLFFVALLVTAAARGHDLWLWQVLQIMALKLMVDMAFHAWAMHAYARWVGTPPVKRPWLNLVVTLVEPFSFQLLRHLGAALGWLQLLQRNAAWGTQMRAGLRATAKAPNNVPSTSR